MQPAVEEGEGGSMSKRTSAQRGGSKMDSGDGDMAIEGVGGIASFFLGE